MPGLGSGRKIEDIRAARGLQERVQSNNVTPPADLAAKFDGADVAALNAYQWRVFDAEQGGPAIAKPEDDAPVYPASLMNSPVSPAFFAKYSDRVPLFTQNMVGYNDATEDVIADDLIVLTYLPRTRTNNPDSNMAASDVLRARRTTIGLLTHLGASAARPIIENPDHQQSAA